jgi:hypothetical protein
MATPIDTSVFFNAEGASTVTRAIQIVLVIAVIVGIVGFAMVRAILAPMRAQPACTIEGTAEQQQQLASWCEGGVFTNVAVKNDAAAMVAVMTFSSRGFESWNADHARLLDFFGQTVDRLARVAPGGVAVALLDPNGEMVGGCTREALAPRTLCRTVP